MTRKLFVTTALPYANGPFHIGHIMEYIQADIWVRFQRMLGHVGAFRLRRRRARRADHAQGRGRGHLARGADCARHRRPHQRDYLQAFTSASIIWYTTDSPENVALSQDIYRRLKAAGLIYVKPVEQFYDPVKAMFLADRYIKGECPNCAPKDQYGDACEICSSSIRPTDLIDPYSTLTGREARVMKTSDHYFFRLSDPQMRRIPERMARHAASGCSRRWSTRSREWLGAKATQALDDWDISRDAPYFGIRDPRTRPANISTCGWTRRSAISRACKNYFDTGKARARGETSNLRRISRGARHRAVCTSSARTSSTSTRCSGRRC